MINKTSNKLNIHQELIEACKKGDKKSQYKIYSLYNKAMYNTSLRIVGNIHEAEDIMQEAFLKAFSNLQNFKAEVNFGAWLKKIVVNLSLDSLRKNKTFFESLHNQEVDNLYEEENETEGEYKLEDIKSEINKLPGGYRIVLSLYLLEGYDHEEIGEILKISASTSRSQYTRSRKKLAENLKNLNNE